MPMRMKRRASKKESDVEIADLAQIFSDEMEMFPFPGGVVARGV